MTSVHVDTPHGFTATLRDPDPSARRAALAALATRDPGAVALARGDAQTVLGVLSGAFDPSVSTPYDRAVLAAIDALDDASASPLVALVFDATDDADVRRTATDVLARWGDRGGVLRASLARSDRPDLRALAATALDPTALPAHERLLAAAVRIEDGARPDEVAPDPRDVGLREAYLDQVRGPHRDAVQRAAEAHGAAGFAAIAGHDVDDAGTRTWLASWAGRVRSVAALAYLEARLEAAAAAPPCASPDPTGAAPDRAEPQALLDAVQALGPLAEPLRPAARRWAAALRDCAPSDPLLEDVARLAADVPPPREAPSPSEGATA